MKKNELSKIFQFSGFLYYKPKSGNVVGLYPTDLFMGSIINGNSREHGIEYLIDPYSMKELKECLMTYGRNKVLNSRVLKVKPYKECEEFVGTISSMSNKTITHKSLIRNIFDPTRIEFRCSCPKKMDNRDVRDGWDSILLIEWRPFISEGKHYLEAICPHVSALKSNLQETRGINLFGFDDGLDFMKPYVTAYIEVLKHVPKLRDYAIDFAFTWYSSMFDKVKEHVNKMRKSIGLTDLTMYDMESVRGYVEYMLVKGGCKRSKLNEAIEIAKSI